MTSRKPTDRAPPRSRRQPAPARPAERDDVATLLLAPDRTLRRLSPAAARLLALAPEDVGRPVHDLGQRLPDPELLRDIDSVLASGATAQREVPTADGRCFLRRVSAYHALDDRVRGTVVTYADVSTLKEAETRLHRLALEAEDSIRRGVTQLENEVAEGERTREALRAERDLLESVLQAVPTLIVMADGDGRIVRFNRAAEQGTGLTAAQAIGRLSWEILLPPEEHETARARFASVKEGQPQHCGSLLGGAGGSRRRVTWTLSALDGAQRPSPYVIIAGVDVTEVRTAAERERERLDELARLHRLHTAGELAAMLAHEINQPLAAIAHYAEAGLIQPGDATQRRFFQQIAEQAQRAGRTIRELRDFLDKAPMALAQADANAAAEAARRLTFAYAAARGVAIELDLDERVGPVAASAVQLQHILVNLIRNAVEAIAGAGMADGAIFVRTRRLDEPARVRITVEDSGPGIGAADADKVFASFYTTKADGLGMGLRISRRLAQAHGGQLWVEPHQPGGRFHLDLESARVPPPAQENA